MTMGAMTILSQQYGSDNGDNRKGLKSVKNFRETSGNSIFTDIDNCIYVCKRMCNTLYSLFM